MAAGGGRSPLLLLQVRSEIGVQFVLFNSCMQAARQAFNLLRNMQVLIGEVER